LIVPLVLAALAAGGTASGVPQQLPTIELPAELQQVGNRSRAGSAWSTPALERLMIEWEVKLEKMLLHLQPAMRRAGIDMWIIMSREFNVDPMLQMFGDYGISGW
jgi:hypothetical protein